MTKDYIVMMLADEHNPRRGEIEAKFSEAINRIFVDRFTAANSHYEYMCVWLRYGKEPPNSATIVEKFHYCSWVSGYEMAIDIVAAELSLPIVPQIGLYTFNI